MSISGKVCIMLGLDQTTVDEATVAKINTIIEGVSDRLKNLLGGVEEIPNGLTSIVVDVSVARFNRIGSEGSSSHSVEGESLSWSADGDFEPYMDEIKAWLDAQEKAEIGRIRFI